MKMIMRPALALLNSLRYAYKFILIGLLVLALIAVTLYVLAAELNKGQDFARQKGRASSITPPCSGCSSLSTSTSG